MQTFYILLAAIGGLIVGFFMGFAVRKRLHADGHLNVFMDSMDKEVYLSAEFDIPLESALNKGYVVLDVERKNYGTDI